MERSGSDYTRAGECCREWYDTYPGDIKVLERKVYIWLGSALRIMQSIDANSAAACSEFEACVRPVTYFIAAKFLVYSATPGPCIQAKCPSITQPQLHLATSRSD